MPTGRDIRETEQQLRLTEEALGIMHVRVADLRADCAILREENRWLSEGLRSLSTFGNRDGMCWCRADDIHQLAKHRRHDVICEKVRKAMGIGTPVEVKP